uniref:SusE n=1 Tax=uncultured Bacteroidota bacterium TaxID=152509 RepID=A0A097KUQ3_9BACT|nr:SusE [uncultured Bacteroidetes bacterium]
MKKVFKHIGIFLSVALMGALSSCIPQADNQLADLGLGIKVFFPTKVVEGQPMTINGSGLSDVKEIEFPNGVKVTDFEIVSNEMIRVTAPAGIAADGGKLIVRSADQTAESSVSLTLGKTVVSGFSKQEGEEITGGEQIIVYGTDLEFINAFEILDPDGNPLLIPHEDFYRKGTSSVIITLPKKIFEGSYIANLYTYDGRSFNLPELSYKPAADGGHWETVETVIWENDGSHGEINWSSDYRFSSEEASSGEEIYAIPMDLWEQMKAETFYVLLSGEDPQIRVTTGWWSTTWTGNDITPGNELLTDNGDGTYTLAITLAGDPIMDVIDEQHLLLTGGGYTPLKIFFLEEEWIEGGGHEEIVKTSIWKNDGSHGEISWSSDYRFSSEEASSGEEIYAIPMDLWEQMKAETFYVLLSGEDPQIRVTTGWWSTTWTGNDITPGNELLTDNGDGTYTLAITLAGDPIMDVIDEQHLLLTGGGYTPLELYFEEVIWVDGGDGDKEVVFWENDGSHGGINWSGDYRFGLDGNDGNNECIATFPEDVWNVIKTGTFYLLASVDDAWHNVRVTTGWWDPSWNAGDIGADNEMMVHNDDGTFTIELNFTGDANFVDALDQRHLLFTGEGYTPLKLYYIE